MPLRWPNRLPTQMTKSSYIVHQLFSDRYSLIFLDLILFGYNPCLVYKLIFPLSKRINKREKRLQTHLIVYLVVSKQRFLQNLRQLLSTRIAKLK